MSNLNRTTLYIGVTHDLEIRVLQHKAGIGSIFTKRYRCTDLLYFEEIEDIELAIAREKQLKRWHRNWKLKLIKDQNPEFKDLAASWFKPEEIRAYRNSDT